MGHTIYIVRHATSAGSRADRTKWGVGGSALTDQGIQQAKDLNQQFIALGIDPLTTAAATSDFTRTKQTAAYAGFMDITTNDLLNEVTTGLSSSALEEMLNKNQLPEAALRASRALLANPPKEHIWFTHGLVIAGIAHLLNMEQNGKLLIPDMASITNITLES